MKKLPQLTQSTRMLVCGEDLGMIPDCVAWVMNDLRILSLEIQRMPKNPAEEFGRLNEYPYRSVCTFSTHDMSTLRGWWEEDYQPDPTLLQSDAGTLWYRSCHSNAGAVRRSSTQSPLQQFHPLHPIPARLAVDGWKMAQPECTGRTDQYPRQSASLLALPDAPDTGTTDESRKPE